MKTLLLSHIFVFTICFNLHLVVVYKPSTLTTSKSYGSPQLSPEEILDELMETFQNPLVTRVKRQLPTGIRVRKEWRRMSTNMKKSFIKHFNNLCVQCAATKSKLQVFATFLHQSESPGAYAGPAFLPWHREFLYRFENILVANGYKGALPYWKSGLDHDLPKPEESAIFTAKELGASNGKIGKPFVITCADCGSLGPTVERYAGPQHKDYLFHRQKVKDLPWNSGYANFSNQLEMSQNGVHWWFGSGSNMMTLNCVGFDPIFYMHQAYIDYLWEEYRKKQTLVDRENDYPQKAPLHHQKYRAMLPFDDIANIDGLRNEYTNTFYKYERSPDKCKTDKSCKSSLLWCNNRLCQGKIREGGECVQSLKGSQCYCEKKNPVCLLRRCRCY